MSTKHSDPSPIPLNRFSESNIEEQHPDLVSKFWCQDQCPAPNTYRGSQLAKDEPAEPTPSDLETNSCPRAVLFKTSG